MVFWWILLDLLLLLTVGFVPSSWQLTEHKWRRRIGIRHNGNVAPHSAAHYDGLRRAALFLVMLCAKQLPLCVWLFFFYSTKHRSWFLRLQLCSYHIPNAPPPIIPFATPASFLLHPNSPIKKTQNCQHLENGRICIRQREQAVGIVTCNNSFDVVLQRLYLEA